LVGQVLRHVTSCDWRAAITCTGRQNPAKSAAGSVQRAACEKELCTSARNVMWVCAWYLVSQNITQKRIYNKRVCVVRSVI
jgi:hypothetical protein